MRVVRLDRLVLTVTDVKETCDFYSQVLGREVVNFGGGRKALNLHQVGKELEWYFDYWGCPYSIRESFIQEITSLIDTRESKVIHLFI